MQIIWKYFVLFMVYIMPFRLQYFGALTGVMSPGESIGYGNYPEIICIILGLCNFVCSIQIKMMPIKTWDRPQKIFGWICIFSGKMKVMNVLRIDEPWGSNLWPTERSSWHFKPKVMQDFCLWFIFSGRGQMRLSDRLIDLFPGSIFCLRPGHDYYATQDRQRPLGNTFVHFDFLDRRGKIVMPRDVPPHFVVLPEVEFYDRLTRRIVELMDANDPNCLPEADLHLQSALQAMRFRAAQFTRSSAQREQNEAVNATRRYIRDNPAKFFSIAELADRVGYSTSHFAEVFGKIAGMPPKEFCIRVRLERAQTLLSESNMGIEEIAAELGYADVFFFSRQFKQRLGVSPTTWRARPHT